MYSSVFVSVALCASSAISHSPIAYQFDPLRHLSAAAQPFDPLNPPSDPAPPQGCNVTRAAYLVRHAAIYANDYDYDTYIEPFVQKLSNTTVDWSKIPDLAFLSTWRNPISDPEIEMLTRDGKLEATKLGVQVAQKYPMFRTPEKIWTSTAERTRKSAKAFAGGNALDNSSDLDIVQVYEGEEEGADSLTPYESCPAYSSSAGNDQSEV
jgi:acid phosphatase